MPIGDVGVSMVDTRDIADIAVHSLMRRAEAKAALPREVIDVVGPDALTGPQLAKLWSDVLGRTINYGGNDLAAFEKNMAGKAPTWAAYDMRLMLTRFHSDGMRAKPGAAETLAGLLGRPLRSYKDFATEMAKSWATAAA
jgi:uncharacterized protein YbjT (DUF2867 family)